MGNSEYRSYAGHSVSRKLTHGEMFFEVNNIKTRKLQMIQQRNGADIGNPGGNDASHRSVITICNSESLIYMSVCESVRLSAAISFILWLDGLTDIVQSVPSCCCCRLNRFLTPLHTLNGWQLGNEVVKPPGTREWLTGAGRKGKNQLARLVKATNTLTHVYNPNWIRGERIRPRSAGQPREEMGSRRCWLAGWCYTYRMNGR